MSNELFQSVLAANMCDDFIFIYFILLFTFFIIFVTLSLVHIDLIIKSLTQQKKKHTKYKVFGFIIFRRRLREPRAWLRGISRASASAWTSRNVMARPAGSAGSAPDDDALESRVWVPRNVRRSKKKKKKKRSECVNTYKYK